MWAPGGTGIGRGPLLTPLSPHAPSHVADIPHIPLRHPRGEGLPADRLTGRSCHIHRDDCRSLHARDFVLACKAASFTVLGHDCLLQVAIYRGELNDTARTRPPPEQSVTLRPSLVPLLVAWMTVVDGIPWRVDGSAMRALPHKHAATGQRHVVHQHHLPLVPALAERSALALQNRRPTSSSFFHGEKWGKRTSRRLRSSRTSAGIFGMASPSGTVAELVNLVTTMSVAFAPPANPKKWKGPRRQVQWYLHKLPSRPW